MYGPLIRFEMQVKPIPHGVSGRNVPLIMVFIVCMFFPPTPPSSQIPVSFDLSTFSRAPLFAFMYLSIVKLQS